MLEIGNGQTHFVCATDGRGEPNMPQCNGMVAVVKSSSVITIEALQNGSLTKQCTWHGLR